MNERATQLAVAAGFLLLSASGGAARSLTLEPEELAAFVDGIVEPAMTASGVPGAVVTIVGNGQILLARGYGVADVGSGDPVSPATTLFNTASIGKTMTAIVALNLEEQGIVSF